MGEEKASASIAPTSEFWRNRKVQVIVTYLVGCWTLLEFTSFITVRFFISHHWVDLILFALLLMFPSVMLGVWARSSENSVLRRKRYFMPLNVLIAFGILTYLFWGKDLGFMKRNISFEDEFGEQQSAVLIDDAFLDQVAVFPFDAIRKDTAHDWLEEGIANALVIDLEQFNSLYVSRYEKTNSNRERVDLVQEGSMDYFLHGTYLVAGDTFQINGSLFSNKGRRISEISVKGSQFFDLLDSISIMVQNHVANADLIRSLEIYDQPLSEILTEDIEAYRLRCLGFYNRAFDRDSTYAMLAIALAGYADFLGFDHYANRRYIELAMQNRSKLPAIYEMRVRVLHYLIQNDTDKAIKVAENFILLNPNNIDGKLQLMYLYGNFGWIDEAIDVAFGMLRKHGPIEDGYDYLIDLLLLADRLDEAEKLIKDFIDTTSWQYDFELGLLELLRGNFEQAKDNFESGKLVMPESKVLDSAIRVCQYYQEKDADQIMSALQRFEGVYRSSDRLQSYNLISKKHYLQEIWDEGTSNLCFLMTDSLLVWFDQETVISNELVYGGEDSEPLRLLMVDRTLDEDIYTQWFWRSGALIKKGESMIRDQDFDSALICYKQALEAQPGLLFLQDLVGHLEFRKSGNYDEVYMQALAGDYTNRELRLKNRSLYYLRTDTDVLELELLALPSDDWIVFLEYADFKLRIVREGGNIVGLQGWYYDEDSQTYRHDPEDDSPRRVL